MVSKILNLTFRTIITVVILVVLILGILGGGWGAKDVVNTHPFYSGNFTLVAHRGVSDQAPENTIASAARARALGFKFIELDIKQSKDERFYLFHDRHPRRLFGTDIPLKDQSFSELQKIPLLHAGLPTDHRVPALDEFSGQFSSDLTFYLDIKRHGNYRYEKLTKQITGFIERDHLSDRCLIGSDFLFTAYLEYRYPDLHTVFTGPGDWTVVFYRWIPRKFRPDFIISYAEEVTDWHLDWLRKNNLVDRRMLYGVDGKNYNRVRKWGVPYLVVEYDPIMKADL